MNAETEELQHRERSGRGGCVIAAVTGMLVFYALSPPFLIMLARSRAMSGWGGVFRDLLMIYAPLEYLADHVRWIGDFYNWYLGLFGVP